MSTTKKLIDWAEIERDWTSYAELHPNDSAALLALKFWELKGGLEKFFDNPETPLRTRKLYFEETEIDRKTIYQSYMSYEYEHGLKLIATYDVEFDSLKNMVKRNTGCSDAQYEKFFNLLESYGVDYMKCVDPEYTLIVIKKEIEL